MLICRSTLKRNKPRKRRKGKRRRNQLLIRKRHRNQLKMLLVIIHRVSKRLLRLWKEPLLIIMKVKNIMNINTSSLNIINIMKSIKKETLCLYGDSTTVENKRKSM